MIVVTTEPERKLVRVVMSGLLTVAEVERFSRDEQAAVRAMGLRTGEFLLLVDTIGTQVHTREVTEAFQSLMLDSPLKARRIALVRMGTLAAMQSRRISTVRSYSEVFATAAEAEEWLFEP